jgi:AraC-like DNA-binding protein
MVDAVDLYNACLFIQDNLDADLSLMFLAQTVGLSRFRFHRVFKAWAGETLHDFVTRLRMERAAFELGYPIPQSNRRSVKAIAFASGYKSLSSFSHAFSSYSNLSPRQFRHRVQNERALANRSLLGDGARQSESTYQAIATLFAPCQLSIREEPQRRLEIVGSVTSKPAYGVAGALEAPYFAVESMPGLFARTQRPNSFFPRTTPLSCLAVEAGSDAASGDGAKRAQRRAPLTVRGGRYAVLEGDVSLSQLYRLWRRRFDAWLLVSGECPRADRAFFVFPAGWPVGLSDPRRMALYIPLEALAEKFNASAQLVLPARRPEMATAV